MGEQARGKGGRAQTFAIWFMQFNQAITVTLPYSLVVYMVRDFLRAQADASGGTVDEKQVGSRSGVLAGTLSFAACLSSFPWGWASDRIGRKAVIQIGGLGQMLSMLGLGFAGSYPAAIAARFVGGILNGTTGALKTTIAESYTEQQQAQVLGYLSFGWGAGTIIGPAAGGFLAQPCDSFPHAFGSACAPGGLLARLPYLLPCLLAAFAALQSVVTVTLFLQESLDRSLQRERLGSRGSALLAFWGGARAAEAEDGDEELELVAFANEGSGGGGVAEAGAPRAQSAHGVADSARHSDGGGSVRKASTRRSLEVSIDLNGVACIDVEDCADRRRSSDVAHASNYGDARDGEAEQLLSPASQRSVASGNSDAPWYTDRRMLLILIGYGLVAFTYNMLDEVVPIYAATPKSHYGLGLSSSQLGVPLSVGGVALMFLAVFVYPRVRKRTGTYWACRIGLTTSIGVSLLFPTSSLVAASAGDVAAFVYLSFVVCIRSASAIFAFTSVMVMVNLAAPKAHIGAVNGVGQALASFVRGIGPALGGTLWSLSISSGLAGSEFFVFLLISGLGVAGNVLFAAIGPD